MRRNNIFALLIASALGGCMVHGRATTGAYYASGDADLVYVSPGVYAVADYDQPVFYSDNTYWLYRDGGWYQSPYYTGGWSRAYNPPSAVVSIERPTRYVHYRGEGRPRIRAHQPHNGYGYERGRRR